MEVAVAAAVLLPLLLVQTLMCCGFTEVTQPSLVQLQAIGKANQAKAGVVAPSGPVIARPLTAAPPDIAVAAEQGEAMALAPVLPKILPASTLFLPSLGLAPEVPKHSVAFPLVCLATSYIQRTNVPISIGIGTHRQHNHGNWSP